jgi:hypothetical protein
MFVEARKVKEMAMTAAMNKCRVWWLVVVTITVLLVPPIGMIPRVRTDCK